MAYCGFPTGVNKRVLDSTNVTVGEGATVQESLESGGPNKSRLSCANPPDKYSVQMDFDYVKPVWNGYTELDLFWTWYKSVHKYGTVPFEFPAILINSNRRASLSVEELNRVMELINNGDTSVDYPETEYYKITSAVNATKSGLSQRVSMTWETYATGTIQVEADETSIDRVEATNGCLKVVLTGDINPIYTPNAGTWTFYIEEEGGEPSVLSIISCHFDGVNAAYLYFEELPAGTYTITGEDIQPVQLVVGE